MAKIYKGKIRGNLTLFEGDDASEVVSVGGYVYVSEGAKLDLPVCTTVGGSVDVREGAKLDLPVCTTVGGYVDVSEGAKLDLPVCTTVGGYALPDPATAQARLVEVAKHALANNGACLKMKTWHTKDDHGCETAHCVSGWSARLNGQFGLDLEKKVGHPMTGNVLLGIEASKLFYLKDDAARSALYKVLEAAGEVPLQPADAAS
jgi:hypothetical protein